MRVTDDMNNSLLKPFMGEEVRFALHQMAPTKAPGPDGFPAGFFQKNWDVLGEDIIQATLDTLNSGAMPDFLNMTNIALIPKVKNPTKVTEFKPISLCNVLYKVISKVLANRLKKVLMHIISPVQSAFIPGRLITDNVLVAYETLHTMHTCMKGKKGFMAVKLDMSKAYDRVEWSFLEQVMYKMGFDQRWIDLIMMCVTTVRYAIVVNGQPCGSIIPERGLRQGDPISPYLFLLCAEALSSMLMKANREGVLTGVLTSKRGPRISHLFFADDSLLFCRSTKTQWQLLTTLLKRYEEASGQRLNSNKTSIFFSKNSSLEDKKAILEEAGIPDIQCFDTYLGLPALVGKSRTAAFWGIIDRVRKCLSDWKLKFLSQAGKEILIKAVIQAIPAYCMSLFLIPKTLCLEINAQIRKFWWNQSGKDSRINWMSWNCMSVSKSAGGMGFRDFSCFNQALLAKQIWRMWKNPDSLVAQLMQAKYFPGKNILEATMGRRPSFAWRSIHGSCDLLKEGLIWRVGNGYSIKIWKDRWLPNPTTYQVFSPPTILDPNASVNELLDGDSKWWNSQLVESIFSAEESQLILSIPPSSTNQPDTLIWRGSPNGCFTVRSAYYIQLEITKRGLATCSTNKESTSLWKQLWALKIPNNQKNFLWRASQDILPTRGNLRRRKITDDYLCPICGLSEETTVHILWQCPSAVDVWSIGSAKLQKSSCSGKNFRQIVEDILEKSDQEDVILFAGIARRLWMRRNEVVFGGSLASPQALLQATHRTIEDYQLAQGLQEKSLPDMTVPHQTIWTAPPPGWFKANWDASLDSQRGLMGCAVVVRDHVGKMTVAKCTLRKGCPSPLVAEALAALMGMRLCREMGLQKVEFEGDAKTIVEAMNHGAEDRSSLGMILEDLKGEATLFQHWKMSFIKREGNQIAHVLAKYATQNAIDKVWAHPPDCIRDLLLVEHVALAV
jgi:ribonuclease HI